MRQLLAILLIGLITHNVSGQSYFLVEGKTVKTGSVKTLYKFPYYFKNDSLMLVFSDSIQRFYNPEKTIERSIMYCRQDPITDVYYYTTNKQDSIRKRFYGDELVTIHENRFDSLGRDIFRSMRNLNPDKWHFSPGWEITTEYRDSMTATGKISIHTAYREEYYGQYWGEKYFYYRTTDYYDKKNRMTRKVIEHEMNRDPNDSLHIEDVTYIYDDKDSLIEERIIEWGDERVYTYESSDEPDPCEKEFEMEFTVSNLSGYEQLIRQLLTKNKTMLTSSECRGMTYRYISPDKQMELIIKKDGTYHHQHYALVIVTKTLP